MPIVTTHEIADAVLATQGVVKPRVKRAKTPPNGPLGSPGDALVKKSGLPFGLGFAGPGGGR